MRHTTWDTEELIHDGDQYFDRLVSAMDQARRSIEMEVFIFSKDSVGDRVAGALTAAARRGVRVRLIVDGAGSWRFDRDYGSQMREAGVAFKIFHPLPWQAQSPGVAWSFSRFNRRNHRKCCVIDHRVAFIGSLNVSENHSQKARGTDAWRELAVSVSGAPLLWLLASFEAIWQGGSRARHWRLLSEGVSSSDGARSGREAVELNLTSGSRRKTSRRFIKAIRRAHKRVWLVSPYFVPMPSLSNALAGAARRGVDVRLILSARSDMPFVPLVARSFFGYLLRAGVRIFENEKVFVHAKAILIDDRVSVGSMNLNYRTLLHDLELNVILKKPESLSGIIARLREEMLLAPEVRLENWKLRSWGERLLAFFVGRLKRWF